MAPLRVDACSAEEARALLRAACGSTQWVERMLALRPFGTMEGLMGSARAEWHSLTPADWLQAFADHPRIGDRANLRRRFPETARLASAEQSGVAHAPAPVLDALAAANASYERRFGYIFIVCATGLSAEEMLGRLRERLGNDPETELRIAAEEQAKITELRLRRMAAGDCAT